MSTFTYNPNNVYPPQSFPVWSVILTASPFNGSLSALLTAGVFLPAEVTLCNAGEYSKSFSKYDVIIG